jgi:quercetin dioxygenase-like cupin family protein
MPIVDLNEVPEELVTPKHSTAAGRLITGEQVELGMLRFKAGEGARMHSHPHEQIFVILKGKVRVTLGDEVRELTAGKAVHVPPNVPHATEVLEDTEIVSCKGVLDGVGHKI